LRAIDLLQDPIDPKELVSSLRTKASYFDVVIPRPTGVNLVAGLPPQDPSNGALEHGPSQTQAENLALANTGHDYILWVMNRQ
jgi:hypothetical protein